MFKFVFVFFITVLCTYLVFSSTSPNQSELASNHSGSQQENSESLLWFDFDKIQEYFLKSYEYVQHYFTLIFVENQFHEAGEAVYQDIKNLFKHLEEFVRSIDYTSVVSF